MVVGPPALTEEYECSWLIAGLTQEVTVLAFQRSPVRGELLHFGRGAWLRCVGP